MRSNWKLIGLMLGYAVFVVSLAYLLAGCDSPRGRTENIIEEMRCNTKSIDYSLREMQAMVVAGNTVCWTDELRTGHVLRFCLSWTGIGLQ